MSDPWQYRVRVTGPDREKWWERARERTWGLDRARPLISWPYKYKVVTEYETSDTWYNVTATLDNERAEFFGNYSGSPGEAFSLNSRFRVGAALFDGLDIMVEIVGHSWLADTKTGVYSYRDVYDRGALVEQFCEKADDSSIAEKYAPELLAAFPDTRRKPAERDEDDDPEADEEEFSIDQVRGLVLQAARRGRFERTAPEQIMAELVDHKTPPPTHCPHGVPYDTETDECKECATQIRDYLHGLHKRPVL